MNDKGKPFERLGRKATGLRFLTRMAELPKIVIILGGLILSALTIEKDIDTEWLELINEAKKIGLSIDEIRDFLNRSL